MKTIIGSDLTKKILLVIIGILISTQPSYFVFADSDIPEWIKNNAKWWSQNEIDDGTYLNAIEFLINSEIIKISSFNEINSDRKNVPEWIKNNAKWWSQNEIDDGTYLNAIEFLINSEIISFNTERYREKIPIQSGVPGIFKIWTWEYDLYFQNDNRVSRNLHYSLIDDFNELYKEIGMIDEIESVVVVLPIFTSSAYSDNGFYHYYRGECDSCKTTKIIQNNQLEFINASQIGARILGILGYPLITDIDVDKNPEILKNFDTIILLHNEYVTKKEFDAITSHPNVIYLYPNSLYAEISVDYEKNTMTLVRGHGYPVSDISNGFDWEFDNTHPYEYDDECENWEFYEINNGKMLNCYPEFRLVYDIDLLEKIKSLVS